MERIRGAIAVFIGAASFGILSTIVKKAYAAGFTLGEVTGVQVLMGMLFLWILFGLQKIKGISKDHYPSLTAKWKVILAGVSTGAVSVLYYKCVQLMPASIAIILLMQFIWISAIINYVVYKQKPSTKLLLGIVGILGATILAAGLADIGIEEFNIMGLVYGILSATAYAIFITVNSKVGNDYPPLHKSALMLTGSFIFIFILFQPVTLFTNTIDLSIYKYGALLSLFGTVIPPLLFAYGMPKTGISLGSILSAVELPVAVAMSYFILYEPVTYLQWIGVIGILVVVIWINTQKRRLDI